MPKRILLLPLISGLAAHAQAQDATLEGRVLNALTGAPVPGTLVLLINPETEQSYHASADAQGRFVLLGVATGKYYLSAARSGYVEILGTLRQPKTAKQISLTPGESRTGLELRMTPAAVISGRVRDAEGEPMAGLAIAPAQVRYVAGRRQMTGMGEHTVATSIVITNDRGEYRIYGLPPGKYYVAAMELGDLVDDFAGLRDPSTVDPVEAQVAPPKEAHGIQYYPGVADPAQAAAVEVRMGEERSGVDILYDYVPLVSVRGRIAVPASCTGAVVFSARREIDARQKYPIRVAYSDDGAFELRGIAPGAWRISAEQWKQSMTEPHQYCSTNEALVMLGRAGANGVSLTMQPLTDLGGTVRIEHAPGLSLKGVRLWAESMEEGDKVVSSEINTDGSFKMSLDQRHWSFGAESLPANAFIKSASLNGKDVLDTGLDTSSGPVSGRLEVVLSAEGAQIDGLVLDASDRPAAQAIVTLAPEPRIQAHSRLFREVVTDEEGRFTLRGIAPGEYKLFAWDHPDDEAYRDPDFLSAHEGLGTRLDVKVGEAIQMRFRLIAR